MRARSTTTRSRSARQTGWPARLFALLLLPGTALAAEACREGGGEFARHSPPNAAPASAELPPRPSRGSNPDDAGGGEGGRRDEGGQAGTPSTPPQPETTPAFEVVHCRTLPGDTCAVEGEGPQLVFRGDVLAPGQLLEGGEIRVREDGTIACAACSCPGEPARRVACPGALIAPGLLNAHDHVAYAADPPRPLGSERYDHRHDWRLGLRGHAALDYQGAAPAAARAAHELRQVMAGTTSIAGGAGHRGLSRNLDVPGLDEGLGLAPADSDTFPLDDARGLLLESGCRYGSGRTEAADAERFGAYLPHLGEGVDAASRNELACSLDGEPPLLGRGSGVVHAIAADAVLARRFATRGAAVVWSPRSNLALYGNTAPVPLFLRSGVRVALGTDWLLTGSMNLLRELACARSFSERYLDGALDDATLVAMVTASAARVLGAGSALGRIGPGYHADLVIFERRGLEAHRALVEANPRAVLLVLRGGLPLYGDAVLVEALAEEECESLDVCGAVKRACLSETGLTLATLTANANYPLFACGEPPDEPSCVPSRPGEYDGVPKPDDRDGDGLDDAEDLCPNVFDPPRAFDAGPADADGDGLGDACDPCPLDESCDRALFGDLDGDGIPDSRDLCPETPDPAQSDRDGDGKGDACDPCRAPDPGATPCPVTIAALRDPAHPERIPRHALVELAGAEVIAVRPDSGSARGYYLQDGLADYSGIFVYTAGESPGVAEGDWVAVKGRRDLYSGVDELAGPVVLGRYAAASRFSPRLAAAAEVGDAGNASTRLLSMLVTIENARVTGENPDAPADYDETLLDGALRLDDLLDPNLDNGFAAGTVFRSVTGVLGRSFGHMKLWPRSGSDLELADPAVF